jgi:hypothetical protein
MDPKNKVFWEEFIEIYRQNSCLWEVKSKDYSNKMKRNSAFFFENTGGMMTHSVYHYPR